MILPNLLQDNLSFAKGNLPAQPHRQLANPFTQMGIL